MQKTEHGGVGGLSEAVLAMQAVVVPFVGVLGNMVNRIRLITLGALVWAAMSVAFGLSTSYTEVSVLQLSPGCLYAQVKTIALACAFHVCLTRQQSARKPSHCQVYSETFPVYERYSIYILSRNQEYE